MYTTKQQPQKLKQSLPPTTTHHSRRHRQGTSILILLPLLALLVILGGDLNLQLFPRVHKPKASEAVTGPFVGAPLDTMQVNALGQLMNHMQYKQLAKMYVSRMTLDEKLGQLFMVQ